MEYLQYIAREEGFCESTAWWMGLHLKKMHKSPEDSCSAALSLAKREREKEKATLLGKRSIDLKFCFIPRHGKRKIGE